MTALENTKVISTISVMEKTRIFRSRAPKLLKKATNQSLALIHSESQKYHMDMPIYELETFYSYVQLLGCDEESREDFMAAARVLKSEVEAEIIDRFLSMYKL